MGGQERADDRREHETGHRCRNVEPQRPGRRITKAVHRIERGGDLAQSGAQAFQQSLPGLRRRDATRGPVQKPHAEPRFQSPQGLAQGRGRDAAQARHAAEGARPRHRREGFEIREIDIAHCSKIQTACSCYAGLSHEQEAGMIR
jgi:hypothetical protein